MAGRGPAPKDPSQRVRRNKDAVPLRVITTEPSPQPPLPEGPHWPEQTIEWWRVWRDSPLSAEFTEDDWSELIDTAVIHAAFWSGDLKQASELRQRVAKFGRTPEDRARLRIQFAAADEADERRGTRQSASRDRYANIRLAE